MSAATPAKAPFIRVATSNDLNELAHMNQKAFISSAPQTFFSGATRPFTEDKRTRDNQIIYLKYLIRKSWNLNARITVVVVVDEAGKERIAASTIWHPPKAPNSSKSPSTLRDLQMGLFSVVLHWGFGVIGRVSEMSTANKSSLANAYKARKLPGTPNDSWYLQLAGVDPAYQKRGFMSMLLREAFEHAPGAIFTLEANTPASRDVYERFGFEVIEEVIVAKGKVDARGVATTGNGATGFPMYPMIKI
ncbi:hypothetical protein BDP27DRAFT_1329422 [Rhodocollybia butyracea]|uniref:N-acetyltransferase domain-containing protein n=1 Tax=Rhodocollybia butyracea TaxID=206335 RepID=A0A9P5PSH9_9AGAR|nr:hypothetical protein BDP27DRAFT_1329422 [Rhodocollybia butyracea]